MRYEIEKHGEGFTVTLCDGPRDLLMKRKVKTKSEAVHAVASIMRYGGDHDRYRVGKGMDGLYYISIHSPSGRNLGFCNPVGSEEERDELINICTTASQMAKIMDLA